MFWSVDWIHPAQCRDWRWAFVITIMNLQVLWKAVNFLPNRFYCLFVCLLPSYEEVCSMFVTISVECVLHTHVSCVKDWFCWLQQTPSFRSSSPTKMRPLVFVKTLVFSFNYELSVNELHVNITEELISYFVHVEWIFAATKTPQSVLRSR